MPEPHTTPQEHDKPAFQPGAPTPEDPRQNEPIQDPPMDPEHDDVERINPVRQANNAALAAARRHELRRRWDGLALVRARTPLRGLDLQY
jgi:hypothetical protein